MNKNEKKLTALIKKRNKEGLKVVKEMLNHPLSAKQLESFIEKTQISMKNIEEMKKKSFC